jgi:ethanolamine utilization protein EutN
MLLCTVVAPVWPERQLPELAGKPMVQLRELHGGRVLVALDLMEAGVGATVTVVTGQPAQQIVPGLPVDAVVTAIVAVAAPAV